MQVISAGFELAPTCLLGKIGPRTRTLDRQLKAARLTKPSCLRRLPGRDDGAHPLELINRFCDTIHLRHGLINVLQKPVMSRTLLGLFARGSLRPQVLLVFVCYERSGRHHLNCISLILVEAEDVQRMQLSKVSSAYNGHSLMNVLRQFSLPAKTVPVTSCTPPGDLLTVSIPSCSIVPTRNPFLDPQQPFQAATATARRNIYLDLQRSTFAMCFMHIDINSSPNRTPTSHLH